MPRLEPATREQINDPIGRLIYARKFGSEDAPTDGGTATGAPGNWELVFAHVPEILEHAVRGFVLWQNPERQLDPVLRELAQTRAGWVCGSQFVYSQHCKGLRGEGAAEDKVAAIPHWPVSDTYTPVERAVLAYTDCLAADHGRVPDALFEELQRHLSDVEIIELTYITSMYVMHAGMTRALRLEFDDRDEPVVEVPAPEGFDYWSARTPLVLPD